MLWNIHWLPGTSPKYFLPPLGHLLIFWEAAPYGLMHCLPPASVLPSPAFLYKEFTEARKPHHLNLGLRYSLLCICPEGMMEEMHGFLPQFCRSSSNGSGWGGVCHRHPGSSCSLLPQQRLLTFSHFWMLWEVFLFEESIHLIKQSLMILEFSGDPETCRSLTCLHVLLWFFSYIIPDSRYLHVLCEPSPSTLLLWTNCPFTSVSLPIFALFFPPISYGF